MKRINYISSGIFQNYFLFIPAKNYIKYISGNTRIDSWKSNEMLKENIKTTNKSGSKFAPTFFDHHVLQWTLFN